MMSNFFENWTPAMIDEHNRKVAAGKGRGMQRQLEAIPAKPDSIGLMIFQGSPEVEPVTPLNPLPKLEPTIRPTTDEAELNKTERAFLCWLRQQQNQWIGIQNMTLKLAHDCRYTPDFMSVTGGILTAWDVKAAWKDKTGKKKVHVEDDARAKINIAARLFSYIRFVIVWRDDTKSNWKQQEVKP